MLLERTEIFLRSISLVIFPIYVNIPWLSTLLPFTFSASPKMVNNLFPDDNLIVFSSRFSCFERERKSMNAKRLRNKIFFSLHLNRISADSRKINHWRRRQLRNTFQIYLVICADMEDKEPVIYHVFVVMFQNNLHLLISFFNLMRTNK